MNRAERRAAKPTKKYDRVMLAWVHPGEESDPFMQSVLDLYEYELYRSIRETGAGLLLERASKGAGAGAVAHARNRITADFLKTENDWLLFVDADMGFPPYVIERMLGVAHSGDSFKPIIGGLCFALSRTGFDPLTKAETFECFPTIGIWNRNAAGEIQGYRTVTEYEKDAVLRVDSTGAAMVLIHRSVFEKIGAENWWLPLDVPEGSPGLEGIGHFSEDISFFIRCAEAGFEVWLDTMTRTSHYKQGIYLTEQTWDFQEALKATV